MQYLCVRVQTESSRNCWEIDSNYEICISRVILQYIEKDYANFLFIWMTYSNVAKSNVKIDFKKAQLVFTGKNLCTHFRMHKINTKKLYACFIVFYACKRHNNNLWSNALFFCTHAVLKHKWESVPHSI